MAWLCGGQFLPDAGGVMDQDYRTVRLMNVCHNIYKAVQDAPGYTGKRVHEMPQQMLTIIKMLKDMGLWRPAVTGG